MTDLTDQLDAIQARVDAAEPGPWFLDSDGISVYYVFHNGDTLDRDRLAESSGADAVFIAAAPTDIGFLLALARKQQAAIDAVLGLCASSPDAILANRIHAAIREALEAKP